MYKRIKSVTLKSWIGGKNLVLFSCIISLWETFSLGAATSHFLKDILREQNFIFRDPHVKFLMSFSLNKKCHLFVFNIILYF